MPVPEPAASKSESANQDAIALLRGATGAKVGGDKLMVVPRRSYMFLLRHHESNWDLATEGLAGPMLLPEIVPQYLMAGAAGMRTANRGEDITGMYRDAKAAAIAKGWHYIDVKLDVTDPTHLPTGADPGPWIRTVKAMLQGTTDVIDYHFTPWMVPVRTPADLPQKWRHDAASYNRWRLHLCLTGAIPSPIESVIEDYRARFGTHVDRARGYNNPDRDHKNQKIAAVQAIADVVKSAVLPGEKPKAKAKPASVPA